MWTSGAHLTVTTLRADRASHSISWSRDACSAYAVGARVTEAVRELEASLGAIVTCKAWAAASELDKTCSSSEGPDRTLYRL